MPAKKIDYNDHEMDEELYNFRELNFDFENKFPQLRSVL